MAVPPLPMLKIEELRLGAITRLRAAIQAAGEPNPPDKIAALKDLYIPKHRFEKLRPERAPFLHVAAKTDGGEGRSHQLPLIDLVGTLNFNVLHAATRSGAADLDTKAGQIAQAICIALLEDSSFLEMFSYVMALRFTYDDGIIRGEQGSEYDCVLVQIELEMLLGQKLFEPVPTVPLRVITTGAQLGDDEESIPGQHLVIKQEIEFPEE